MNANIVSIIGHALADLVAEAARGKKGR